MASRVRSSFGGVEGFLNGKIYKKADPSKGRLWPWPELSLKKI